MSADEIFNAIKRRRGNLRHALSSVRVGGIASRTPGIQVHKQDNKNRYRVYMGEDSTLEHDKDTGKEN